jgi:protein-disulfide isomerase
MEECSFCGEEFETERELHVHWGKEHSDELNSHQEDKVKKAERKSEEEKQQKLEKRKKYAFYGLAGFLALAIGALVVPQMIPSGTSTASSLDLEGQPMLGNENASVTVVEFGDYRCPYCARFDQAVVSKLRDQYIETGEVKFYFVNFAFLGQGSQQAAVASECVYNQDKEQFWDFHHAIYENQGSEREEWVTEEFLMNLARENTEGLDYDELQQCISDSETREEVLSDKQMARQNGVGSTPTVFVNDRKINGNSFPVVKSAIEQQLK